MKKNAKSFTLTLGEGPISITRKPKQASTWAEADRILTGWKIILQPSPEGGYYKCDFSIIWEDGEIYNGRYDIDSSVCDLAGHVRDFIMFLAGQRCPAHMSKQQYETFLACDPKTQSEAVDYLSTYQIGDNI